MNTGGSELRGPIGLSLGVFDGVHRGHQAVFDTLRRESSARGGEPVILALDPHPLEVLRPEFAPPLLTTSPERLRLLKRFGCDESHLVSFDRETAGLTASEFLSRCLPDGAELVVLVVGYDFRMGKDRSGGFEELQAVGQREGFDVVRVPPTEDGGEAISSSRVRALISEGEVREAARLLGHRYSMECPVVPGRGVGRTLDFPTANADLGDIRKHLPKFGVYAAFARILETDPESVGRPAVVNLGTRPTFEGAEAALEVHLMGFEGNLLSRRLEIEWVERIRDEQTFESPQALSDQIRRDVTYAQGVLGKLARAES